jgi:hypothetical protein
MFLDTNSIGKERNKTKRKKKSKCFVSNQNFEHGLINFLLGATAFGRTALIRMTGSKTINNQNAVLQ